MSLKQAHGYGSGEEEDGENEDDGLLFVFLRRRGREDKRVRMFCGRSGGDKSTN